MQGIIAFLPRHGDGLPHSWVCEIPVASFSAPIDETRLLKGL
jgi:hypothetical protein